MSNSSDSLAVIQRLQEQVMALIDIQYKMLQDAIYLGMSPDESHEYERRRRKITRLLNEISLVQQATQGKRGAAKESPGWLSP